MAPSTTHVDPLRPMCFIAMPFGCRTADGMTIDFDRTWKHIGRGAEEAGLEPIRADVEPGGGFIHKAMLERLLVAEYVVADVTMANPNVMYEVGVRHGASARATLLLCAAPFVGKIPFDFKPLRMVSYQLGADGSLSDEAGEELARVVREQLRLARSGQLPSTTRLCRSRRGNPPDRSSTRRRTCSCSVCSSPASSVNASRRRYSSRTRRRPSRGWWRLNAKSFTFLPT